MRGPSYLHTLPFLIPSIAFSILTFPNLSSPYLRLTYFFSVPFVTLLFPLIPISLMQSLFSQDYNTLSSSYCSQNTIKSVSKHNTFLQSVSNANQSYQVRYIAAYCHCSISPLIHSFYPLTIPRTSFLLNIISLPITDRYLKYWSHHGLPQHSVSGHSVLVLLLHSLRLIWVLVPARRCASPCSMRSISTWTS